MGIEAAVAAMAAMAGGSAIEQHNQAKQAQRAAADQAALQRQALTNLQAEPAPVIPVADDEASRRARRRSIATQMMRRGRQSTILTADTATGSDALGG